MEKFTTEKEPQGEFIKVLFLMQRQDKYVTYPQHLFPGNCTVSSDWYARVSRLKVFESFSSY
jgi:hypothetical protein